MTITTLQKEVNKVLRMGNCSVSCPVSINNRLSRTLGRAVFARRAGKWISVRIEFSGDLIRRASDKSVMDVLMHECAHVIANYRTGCDEGHGKVFKMVCWEIGTDNDKCSTAVEWKTPALMAVDHHYEVHCPKCGIVARFNRDCKTLQNITRFRCGKCGGHELNVLHF